MLNILKEKNPQLPLYSVDSPEFATYGRIDSTLDAEALLALAATIEKPAEGAMYRPSLPEFEALAAGRAIQERFFGTLPAQVGYCWGENSYLNATEWHFCNEVNIAVTPLVLLLGHVWDVRDGKIDASQFKAFYVPQGTVLEVYATTLHFTPCQVQPEGFGCVVALARGTNTDLAAPTEAPLLFRKNKWLLAHQDNQALLQKGIKPGITGPNLCVKYE